MPKTITQIYADDSITALTGLEKIPLDDPNDSDATKGTLTGNIAALARNISGTDHDIGTGNKTADISALTASGAGTIARYSWYGGAGPFTFSFTNTAGITIDGIASSAYVGEGVGHLDLFVVSASACVTLNRGEIWDSDGGNFASGLETWSKTLSGEIKGHVLFSESAATSSAAGSVFFGVGGGTTFALTSTVAYRAVANAQGSNIWTRVTTPTTTGVTLQYWNYQTSGASTRTNSVFYWGRWTNSFPRIT